MKNHATTAAITISNMRLSKTSDSGTLGVVIE
jgi:hypothetical protein